MTSHIIVVQKITTTTIQIIIEIIETVTIKILTKQYCHQNIHINLIKLINSIKIINTIITITITIITIINQQQQL